MSRGHNKNPEYPPRPSLGEKRAAIQRKADCISPSPQTVTTDFPWWSATPFFIRVWRPRSKTKATNIIVKILFPALNFTIVWVGKGGKAGRRPQHPMVAAFHASLGQAILFGKDWIAWALFSYGKGRMGKSLCSGVDLLKRTVNRLKDTVPSSGRVEDRLLSVMKLFNKRGFLNHAAILEVSWINLGFVIYGFFL